MTAELGTITAEAEDAWTCACGNMPHTDGFYPTLPDGTEVEPLIGGPWDERLMLCGACGRIMDQTTYDPIAGTVAIVRGPGPMVRLP